MTDLTERQKLVAQMAAVLIASRSNPHPSVVQESVRMAKDVLAEVETSVRV